MRPSFQAASVRKEGGTSETPLLGGAFRIQYTIPPILTFNAIFIAEKNFLKNFSNPKEKC